MVGNMLGFGLDDGRCVNGTFLEKVIINHDTSVIFKIVGHAGAPDPKIVVELKIILAKDGVVTSETLIDKVKDLQPKFNLTGSYVEGNITIGVNGLSKFMMLPEKGYNTSYKPEQNYIYVLDSITVDIPSQQYKNNNCTQSSLMVASPIPISTSSTSMITQPETKLEHFKIYDNITFDDTNKEGDFHIYLMLLVLLILIAIYLYRMK